MSNGKHPGGRPSAFKPEYVEQARNYCLLGATDERLAGFFNVTSRTINTWKKAYPEFEQALTNGKSYADALVAKSLFHRAIGYSCPETKINVVDGEIVQTEVVKHFAPDTTACIFFLKNRQPDKWRDKIEVENTAKLDTDMLERLKTEMIERMAAARERQQQVLIERGIIQSD